MTVATKTLEQHYEEFREQGFTVFEQVYSPEAIALYKQTYHRLQDSLSSAEFAPWYFGNACELAPIQMLPAVSNPILLDFAEVVFGPHVQLDNMTLTGYPSISNEEAEGKVSGWHRDRWASFPTTEDYVHPLSMNAISYLQELTDEYGPLRVIPGSHRKQMGVTKEARNLPHSEEILLHMKAGDVVFTHNGLVHSGTPNTSGQIRYFFSIYYNKSWLKHTDNHSGPNVQRIINEARSRNDLRIMRLFGVDEQLEARGNSGFLDVDESRWSQWVAADKAVLKEQ